MDENFRDVQAATTENAELQLKKITNELNQLENSINTTNAKLKDSLENLKNHDIAVEKISKRQTNLRNELVLLEEIIDQIQKTRFPCFSICFSFFHFLSIVSIFLTKQQKKTIPALQ